MDANNIKLVQLLCRAPSATPRGAKTRGATLDAVCSTLSCIRSLDISSKFNVIVISNKRKDFSIVLNLCIMLLL